MSHTIPPIVPRVSAEIHAQAHALGFTVEVYAQTVAGHGITGRLSWSLTAITPGIGGFTNAVSFASGDISGMSYGARRTERDMHDRLTLELRRALDDLTGKSQ